MTTWRTEGYIWGNQRTVVAPSVGTPEPLDLVNLPRFDTPMPIRIDVRGPRAGSAVFVRFFVAVGRGDGFTETQEIYWNRTTTKGWTVVHGTSVRVYAQYVSGLPLGPGVDAVDATAWATPVTDSSFATGRPKPFGTLTANTPGVASGDFHERFDQSATPAVFFVGGESRRITIANYQPASGTAYLYLKYGGLPDLAAGDEEFDHIVAPQGVHIEEAYDGVIGGVWDAAGAGAALFNRWLD